MINPILASSGRRRMRSIRTPLLITLYGGAIFALAMAMAFGGFMDDTISIYRLQDGVSAYAALLAVQFALLLLIAPAMTSGSVSGERERQTLDMLLVTNTGSLRIVAGKLLEALGYIALLLVAALPSMCLAVVTGGVTLADVLTGFLFLLVTAFATLSVGVFASSLFRRTVTATVISYLIVFLIGVVTLLPLIVSVSGMASESVAVIYSSTAVGISTNVDAAAQAAGSMGGLPMALSPAMGLLALINSQTGMTSSFLSYFIDRDLLDLMDFSRIMWQNMAFMAAAGLGLDVLAACFVRPHGTHRIIRGKHK